MSRTIDRIRGNVPGPTLVIVGGMHGNEPAGVEAARTVFARLRAEGVEVCGEVVALKGNVRGLAANRRCLTTDLNRLWTSEKLAAARAAASPNDEYAELVELAAVLDQIIATCDSLIVLDLHTTSAAGIPFGVVGPTSTHRALARAFPIPSIVGLEEMLEGVLTRYLGERGVLTLAVEGGQSGSADAVANLDAVITLALAVTGVAPAEQLTGLAEARARLEAVRGSLPQTIEVVIRHEVEPEHAFKMEPGFANIHATAGGTLLAHDRNGEVRAPFDGLVLLPLYQSEGSDGFFYGRAVP